MIRCDRFARVNLGRNSWPECFVLCTRQVRTMFDFVAVHFHNQDEPSDSTPIPLLRFQAISAGAGLRKIRLHDTRHTHSTMMLDHGVPIHTVSRRLGHSKVSTTLDVYAAFMPSADRVAADVIGQVLQDAKRDTKRAPKHAKSDEQQNQKNVIS